MPVYKNIGQREVLLNREPNQTYITLKPGQTIQTIAFYDDKPELQRLDDKGAVTAALFSQKTIVYAGSKAQFNVFAYDYIWLHVDDYAQLYINDSQSTPLILPPNSTFQLQNYKKIYARIYIEPAPGVSQITLVINCPHPYVDAQYWR